MSVLINGMEMPKDCGHCRFAVDGWCYAYGRANIDALSTYERTNYCPLVELPPHGDLIDRYDLKNKKITIDFDKWDDTFEDGLLFVADLIDTAPTIIEAEGEDGEDEL